MKKLQRLLAALPLVVGINSCSWFVHPTPAPITPNTNDKPTTNLYVSPLSGPAPLNSEIKVNGTDSDDGIVKYRAEIDYNDDGSIDEVISDSKPIDITRTFTANAMVYGTCTDKGGLTDRKGTLITVSATPVQPTNIPPTAELSATPTSGEYPLTSDIKLSGTDPDDNIVDYKLQIDIGADGTIDKTVEQSTPIDISETFNPGNVMIYGTCTDEKGAVSQTKTLEIVVSERNDLVSNVTFGTYKVGDNFGFAAQVQNNTKTDIVIDNIDNPDRDSLEYKIMKINPDDTSTAVLNKTFSDEYSLTLHSGGILKLDYIKNQLSIYDTDVHYGTIINSTWNQIDNPSSAYFYFIDKEGFLDLPIPAWNYPFTEAGNYYLETVVKYSMNGNNYEVKLDSPSFEVNP